MKKRMCCMVLVTSLLLFTGCKKQEETAVPANEISQKEAGQDAVTEEIQEDGETQEQEVAETAAGSPELEIVQVSEPYLDEDGALLIDCSYAYTQLVGGGYEELAQGLEKWSTAEKGEIDSSVKEYAEWAAQERAENEYFNAYAVRNELSVSRADSAVVSLKELLYSYAGGAHGSSAIFGATFDSQTGSQLEITDLMTDMAAFSAIGTEYVLDILAEHPYKDGLFEGYEEEVAKLMSSPDWYLTGQGITVVSGEYLLGPYAMGILEFPIPYELLADCMDQAYLPTGRQMTAELEANMPLIMDITGDGSLDTLKVVMADEDDSGWVSVYLNDNRIDMENFGYYVRGSVLRREDGACYLLLTTDMASDDYNTYLYRLDSGTPVLLDEIFSGLVRGSVTADGFILSRQVDALGTYEGRMRYSIDENEKFHAEEELYTLQNGVDDPYRRGATTKAELTVQIDGADETLPAGATLYPSAGDNEGILYFLLEDGREGSLNYTRSNYEIFIDGVSERDLFEELPYAG